MKEDEEEGANFHSFPWELDVLTEASRFLERKMDVATGDWLASEDLKVCFEILLEMVALMMSIGMAMERHEAVVDGWQVWSSNACRSQRCRDKNF